MKTTRLIPFLIATGFLVACGSTEGPASSETIPSSSEDVSSATLTEETPSASSEDTTSESSSSEDTTSESSILSEDSSSEESSEEEDPFLTIAEAKEKEANTSVSVKAMIASMTSSGFYAKDDTGYTFVYTASSGIDLSGYAIGETVQIDGYASLYNFSHQISSYKDENEEVHPVVLTKVAEAVSFAPEFAPTTIGTLLDNDNLDASIYGTPVKARGYVYYAGEYNFPYGIKDESGDSLLISRYATLAFDPSSLSSLENLYVELNGFVYCYASNAFVLTVDSGAALEAEQMSDVEAVNAAAYYLKNEINGATTTTDYALPSSLYGASITHTSDKPEVLSNAGVYTAPSGPTEVTYTAAIKRGEAEQSATFKITALVASPAKVVLSEVYTAGGNSGATYNCDFVELYNQTDEDVDLSTYSLQNCATGATSTFAVHALSGTIKAHGYFLIRGGINANAAASCAAIEEYDLALDKFNPGAKDYMLALASNQTQVTLDRSGTPVVVSSDNVIDFLGAGKAPAYEGEKCTVPDNAKSLQRIDPEVDTDNNRADFVAATPTPRKSSAQ